MKPGDSRGSSRRLRRKMFCSAWGSIKNARTYPLRSTLLAGSCMAKSTMRSPCSHRQHRNYPERGFGRIARNSPAYYTGSMRLPPWIRCVALKARQRAPTSRHFVLPAALNWPFLAAVGGLRPTRSTPCCRSDIRLVNAELTSLSRCYRL